MSIGRSAIIVLLLVVPGLVAASDDGPVLVLGDSLSAAYGIDPATDWVALLADRIEPMGLQLINASISGETTSGGANRLPALLERNRPSIVMLALGANDGLRGLSLTQTHDNLQAIIEASQQAGARVLLIGIQLPVNYGRGFRERFAAIYPQLAEQFELPLVPFLLAGVALDPELMLGDGVHPNSKAQPVLFATVWAQLQPMIDR